MCSQKTTASRRSAEPTLLWDQDDTIAAQPLSRNAVLTVDAMNLYSYRRIAVGSAAGLSLCAWVAFATAANSTNQTTRAASSGQPGTAIATPNTVSPIRLTVTKVPHWEQ